MKFPEKLRQMRKSAGLTHEQLANAVGLTRTSIIKYEQGDSLPRTDKIYMRIAEFFNVSVDYLKNDSEDDFAKAVESAYGVQARTEADRLIADFRGLFAGGRLSERDRDGVMKAIQEIYWEIKDDEGNINN